MANAFIDYMFGSGDTNQKVSNYSSGQKKFFDNFMKMLQGMSGGAQGAMGNLQDWMDPNSDVYKNFEQPYINEFNQKTVPMLGEQFAGMGGGMGGGLSSSGFGQALGAAGANLQTDLAKMKSDMSRSAINDYLNSFMQMTGQGLGAEPYSHQQVGGQAGFIPEILKAFASSYGKG